LKTKKTYFTPVWVSWVDKEIIKHSGKPFKSGYKKGTIISININPNSNKIAFLMDDDSVVDYYQTKLCENNERERITAIN